MRVEIVDTGDIIGHNVKETTHIRTHTHTHQNTTIPNRSENMSKHNKIAARTNDDKFNLSARSEANKISIHKL